MILQLLRDYGYTITVDEAIEIYRSTAMCSTPDEIKTAIKTIISKNKEEFVMFDEIFEQVLAKQRNWLQELNNELVEINRGYIPHELTHPDMELLQANPSCPQPIGGIAVGAGTGLATITGLVDPESLLQFQSNYKQVFKKLMTEGVSAAADTIVNRYLTAFATNFQEIFKTKEKILDHVAQVLNQINPLVKRQVMGLLEEEVNRQLAEVISKNPKLKIQSLENLDFMLLQDTAEVRKRLYLLGKKLASQVKRKQVKGKHSIDMRKTIRANLQNGGVFLDLKLKKRRKERPRLIVLTDVSPSTVYATRLFLTVIEEIKTLFQNVQYFEFIGSCINVTSEYKDGSSINESIENALSKWSLVNSGKQSSNYQLALQQFLQDEHLKLTPSTIVIMLGDLRDWLGGWRNGKPLSLNSFVKIRDQSRLFFVLNPEFHSNWNTGDSIVSHIQNSGIQVQEVTTISQLEDSLKFILSAVS